MSRSTDHALALALAASVALAPATSWAGEPIVVSDPITEDSLEPAVVQRLMSRLHEAIEGEAAPLDEQLRARAAACEDADCRARVLDEAGASFLLVPTVVLVDEDYQTTLALYGTNGTELARVADTCGLCGLAEAEDRMADLGARIGRKVESASRSGTYRIETDPPGATVSIDDELAGQTPVELLLEDGRHEVTLELDGYVGITRKLDVVAGESKQLDLGLRPVPTALGGERARTLRAVGWSALGVGGALAIGGSVLLGLDHRPVLRDCSGGNIDADGDCRYRYSTLGGGVGLAVTGGLLIGTGVALVVTSWRRAGDDCARVRPSPGGVEVQF